MKTHKDIIQGSDEWLAMKAGKISSSKVSAILTGKKGLLKGAETYAIELIAERIIEEPEIGYTSSDMERGIELELYARDIYAENRKVDVVEVGGIEMGDLWFSPDGLVNADGFIEIKCCKAKRHIQNILYKEYRDEYLPQIQFGLLVSGRNWCDLVLFHPDMPDQLKAKVFRIERDDVMIELIKERIVLFKELILKIEKELKL